MKLILTTHNLTKTDAIESHIVGKIEKLEHIDPTAIDARVTIDHDQTKAPEQQFGCSIRLSVPGPDLFAEDYESDLYAAIDRVTQKIQQQIRKRHSKDKARNHSEGAKLKQQFQEEDQNSNSV